MSVRPRAPGPEGVHKAAVDDRHVDRPLWADHVGHVPYAQMQLFADVACCTDPDRGPFGVEWPVAEAGQLELDQKWK